MELYERMLREDPEFLAARTRSEGRWWRAKQGAVPVARVGVTTVPVVVHVVFGNDEENISDEQVRSQIDVLNQDFRATNADVNTVPAPFAPLVADARIQFELATTDPGGAPSAGITRTQTSVGSFTIDDKVKSAASGGADPWPSHRYLNIWVCQLGNLLGYASLPGVVGGPRDGVVIAHHAFGTTGTARAPFNLGRTTTHEIGHWLNLRHIWGDDGAECNGDDFIDDTPNQAGANFGTPAFPQVTCDNGPNGDLFVNYMDYVDDAVMVMFTHGQVARMQVGLDWDRPSIGREPPRLGLTDFGYDQGWRVDRHVRVLADTTADKRADAVGFGDAGVSVALAQGDGTFAGANLVVQDLGSAQGWTLDQHVRLMADTTADGRADAVGFGNAGVWIARAQPDGSFSGPDLLIPDFGYDQGWRVDQHVRLMADTTADGRADAVGFGNGGVWVARAQPDGSFSAPELLVHDFGYDQGWRVDQHVRLLADTTNDGRADIVGFGNGGVWIARAQPDGSFSAPELLVHDFGYDQGWRVDLHVRELADTSGDGLADVVGFGAAGVWIARAQPDGSYAAPVLAVQDFGYDQGWRVDRHVRVLADTTGDRQAELVGFGELAFMVGRGLPDGGYDVVPQIADFAYVNGSWRVDRHVRAMADVTAEGRADVVGFGDAGVWVSMAQPDGTFSGSPPPRVRRPRGRDWSRDVG
jgi:hypothetical protein